MADSCEMNKDAAAEPVCSPDVASSEATPASTSATTPAETEKQEELPPLSDADFRIYNRMAERMDLFHNHFRHSWTTLWTACTTKRRPQGMSIRQFISLGTSFTSQLTMHHGIEEQHIFPLLARRMPEFRKGTRDGGIMVRQHREIHAGLEGLESYLGACGVGEADFDLAVLRAKMEGWGGVLWEHLDGEVKALGAENMRRYWSKQEMMRMPM